jgi:hypothetical protein
MFCNRWTKKMMWTNSFHNFYAVPWIYVGTKNRCIKVKHSVDHLIGNLIHSSTNKLMLHKWDEYSQKIGTKLNFLNVVKCDISSFQSYLVLFAWQIANRTTIWWCFLYSFGWIDMEWPKFIKTYLILVLDFVCKITLLVNSHGNIWENLIVVKAAVKVIYYLKFNSSRRPI